MISQCLQPKSFASAHVKPRVLQTRRDIFFINCEADALAR
jgi:hypothetical protein